MKEPKRWTVIGPIHKMKPRRRLAQSLARMLLKAAKRTGQTIKKVAKAQFAELTPHDWGILAFCGLAIIGVMVVSALL